jgi:cell fate (sporulation/competence/biofilm development) regulator YlbF (YheA/YmcA/DUF963 family)
MNGDFFMERMDLMTLAYEVSDEIKQSELYSAYILSIKSLEKDSIQPLITAFNIAKNRYNDIMKYGKHHPNFKESSEQLMKAKTALYQTQEYKSYYQAYENLNRILQDATRKITNLLDDCIVSNEQIACQKG